MPRVFFAEANDCNKASNACHKIFLNFFTATIVLPKGERIVYKHKTDRLRSKYIKAWARLFARARMNEEPVCNFSQKSYGGAIGIKANLK